MNDLSALAGKWLPTKAEMDGAAAPDMVIEKTSLTFRGEKYQVIFAGETADAGVCKIILVDGKITLLFESTKGPYDGRRLPAIFQHQGNRLRICFGLDGKLPVEFATAPDSQRYLISYRREG